MSTKNNLFRFLFISAAVSFLLSCSPIASDSQIKDKTKRSTTLKHDPVENDPRYKAVFEKIDAEVAEALKDHPMRGAIGFINIIWDTKQNILKQKYGIDWKTPAEMNPHILFD